ncbi:NTP transferase domain-containing protein [bacterium]|nr:NTP transferase domain-containing protein [bacterium]
MNPHRPHEAVIIAAGNGSRIIPNVNVSHKCLIPILGQKLIRYIIYNLIAADIEQIYIVTGFESERLRHSIRKLTFPVKISFIHNDDWERGNGTSVFCASHVVHSKEFILTMADHWFSEDILMDIIHADFPNVLAVDSHVHNINDIQDATKVRMDADNRILAIGKNLESYNAIDCGIFRFKSFDIFAALQTAIGHNEYSLSGGVRELIKAGKMFAQNIEGKLWQDVDTLSDVQATVKKIQQYKAQKIQ